MRATSWKGRIDVAYRKSGLTAAVLKSKISLEDAEQQVLAFINKHVPSDINPPLAGNTVHMDKFFLIKYMPKVVERLHYRLIDVSTIKELVYRWHQYGYQNIPIKKCSHR